MSHEWNSDFEVSLRLFQTLYPDMKRKFGRDHPDTLDVVYNIALLTWETGRIDVAQALRLFRDILQDQMRVFGAHDSKVEDTQKLIHNLEKPPKTQLGWLLGWLEQILDWLRKLRV